MVTAGFGHVQDDPLWKYLNGNLYLEDMHSTDRVCLSAGHEDEKLFILALGEVSLDATLPQLFKLVRPHDHAVPGRTLQVPPPPGGGGSRHHQPLRVGRLAKYGVQSTVSGRDVAATAACELRSRSSVVIRMVRRRSGGVTAMEAAGGSHHADNGKILLV